MAGVPKRRNGPPSDLCARDRWQRATAAHLEHRRHGAGLGSFGTVVAYVEPNGTSQSVAVTLRTQPDLAVVSRTIVVQDLGHDEADNHANYDVHPKEGRFVIAQRDSDAGDRRLRLGRVVAQPVIPRSPAAFGTRQPEEILDHTWSAANANITAARDPQQDRCGDGWPQISTAARDDVADRLPPCQ